MLNNCKYILKKHKKTVIARTKERYCRLLRRGWVERVLRGQEGVVYDCLEDDERSAYFGGQRVLFCGVVHDHGYERGVTFKCASGGPVSVQLVWVSAS